MIVIPEKLELTKAMRDLIDFFNKLESDLQYPNCEGYADQRRVLILAERELIMGGNI